MWALVESDNITQVYTRPKGLTIGDVNYPSNIFMLWSSSELEAIGIYEVVVDNTNLKDKEYYINTNQSFNFASGTVTASYGTATARPLDDVLFTAQDETDGLGTEGEVATRGLKYNHKEDINMHAAGLLQNTDWIVAANVNVSKVTSQVNNLKYNFYIIFTIMGVLIILLSFLAVRFIGSRYEKQLELVAE